MEANLDRNCIICGCLQTHARTILDVLASADKAGSAGIKAFAMKPLTKREIAKTIRKVLDE